MSRVYPEEWDQSHEWGITATSRDGLRCELCNTTLALFDPEITDDAGEIGYAVCGNCVIAGFERAGVLAALDELCGCEDCWRELERLWEDRENCQVGSSTAQVGAGGG